MSLRTKLLKSVSAKNKYYHTEKLKGRFDTALDQLRLVPLYPTVLVYESQFDLDLSYQIYPSLEGLVGLSLQFKS